MFDPFNSQNGTPIPPKFSTEKRRITAWLRWWWKAGPRAKDLPTQVDLAAELGVTKARITQVFDNSNPGIDLLLAIWRSTGYPLEVLANKDPPAIPDTASSATEPASSWRRSPKAGPSTNPDRRPRHRGTS